MSLLLPDNEHNKVFGDVPATGFCRAKSLEKIFVGGKIRHIKNEGWRGHCKGRRCEIYKHIIPTRNFTSLSTKHTYQIRPESLNCRYSNVVYFISWKVCHMQYNRGSEKFRARFNYKKT